MGRMIDADVLMEELKTPVLIDNEKASRIWEGWHECTIAVKEAIDRTPTVEERKTGKWIRHPEQKNIFGGKTIECSVCGEKYVVQYIEDEKFCRNCGADMREQP